MYNLGLMYKQGAGVTKDMNKAKEWYQNSADLGNEMAKKVLASFN